MLTIEIIDKDQIEHVIKLQQPPQIDPLESYGRPVINKRLIKVNLLLMMATRHQKVVARLIKGKFELVMVVMLEMTTQRHKKRCTRDESERL